jgi:hypothetical protein
MGQKVLKTRLSKNFGYNTRERIYEFQVPARASTKEVANPLRLFCGVTCFNFLKVPTAGDQEHTN